MDSAENRSIHYRQGCFFVCEALLMKSPIASTMSRHRQALNQFFLANRVVDFFSVMMQFGNN